MIFKSILSINSLKLTLIGLFTLFLNFNGCSINSKDQEDNSNFHMTVANKDSLSTNNVSILVLNKQSFKQQLISNGKLVAKQKSILKFEVSGSLKSLNIKNGDKVNKNQILARLDNFKYLQNLERANITYKKAKLELEDMLVGRGYALDNKDSIPENIYEMATLRSGFKDAKYQRESSRFDVNSSFLRAPFAGKVANIKYSPYEQVSAGTEFLTLIDDSSFEVVFNIIESEIDKVTLNTQVDVVAFSSAEHYKGKIFSINPQVGKNGTVEVRALVTNDGDLMEGMNVKVLIERLLPDKFVVPKSAVVLRQDQEVLFKYKNGRAFWTYVNTTNENSDCFAVIPNPEKSSATLAVGDTIIVGGNLNLAHDSEVVIGGDIQ